MKVGVVGIVHTDLVSDIIDTAFEELGVDGLVFNGRLLPSYSLKERSLTNMLGEIGFPSLIPQSYVRKKKDREISDAEQLIKETNGCHYVWNGGCETHDSEGNLKSKYLELDGMPKVAFVAKSPDSECSGLMWQCEKDLKWLAKNGKAVGFFSYNAPIKGTKYRPSLSVDGFRVTSIENYTLIGRLRRPLDVGNGYHLFNSGSIDQKMVRHNSLFTPYILTVEVEGKKKRTVDSVILPLPTSR